jgi:hypothetical protein
LFESEGVFISIPIVFAGPEAASLNVASGLFFWALSSKSGTYLNKRIPATGNTRKKYNMVDMRYILNPWYFGTLLYLFAGVVILSEKEILNYKKTSTGADGSFI